MKDSYLILTFFLVVLFIAQIRFIIRLWRIKKSGKSLLEGLFLAESLGLCCDCIGSAGELGVAMGSGSTEKRLITKKQAEELRVHKFLSQNPTVPIRNVCFALSLSTERVLEIIGADPNYLIENEIIYNKLLLKKAKVVGYSDADFNQSQEIIIQAQMKEDEIKVKRMIPDTKRINIKWLSDVSSIPYERIIEILKDDPKFLISDNIVIRQSSEVEESLEGRFDAYSNPLFSNEIKQKITAGICPDCNNHFKIGSDFCPNCGCNLKE